VNTIVCFKGKKHSPLEKTTTAPAEKKKKTAAGQALSHAHFTYLWRRIYSSAKRSAKKRYLFHSIN